MGHGNLRGAALPQWTGDAASYQAVHSRLRSYRGRAKDQTCACGEPATGWAYDHADPNHKVSETGAPYSTDLARYVALCASCHRLMDTAQAGKSRCGTDSGYYRHRRTGSSPCQPCKDAHTAATRSRMQRRLTDPGREDAA